jgi:hypothetical protein
VAEDVDVVDEAEEVWLSRRELHEAAKGKQSHNKSLSLSPRQRLLLLPRSQPRFLGNALASGH